MKVLLVNSQDTGGAANACIRLHYELLDQGVDSNLLLLNKTRDIPNSYIFKDHTVANKFKNKWNTFKNLFIELLPIRLRKKLTQTDSFLKQRNKNLELFSYPETPHDITTSKLYQDCDIINLHWVAGFLDFYSFFTKNTKPVVWTLHDMNPFTGGEHYTESIIGMSKYGIPIQREINEIEQTTFQYILAKKSSVLDRNLNMHIVSPSKWLKSTSSKSQLFSSFQHLTIPNGIPPHHFRLNNKEFSRQVVGLPENKKVLLFIADSVSNYRKGFEFLLYALNKLNADDIILCAVGSASSDLNKFQHVIHLGFINDHRLLNLCYSAADAFIIPSLMDNLPNTVLESLFCGTPVIGFPVGGIVDMIQHGENGLIADEISGDALSTSIHQFLNGSSNFDRHRIRSKALEKYTSEIQAKMYIDLYTSILNQ